MASLGIRKFQDLVGRTDLLRIRESCTDKAKLLDMSQVLKNALEIRPGTNIVGGSLQQVRMTWVLLVLSTHFMLQMNCEPNRQFSFPHM